MPKERLIAFTDAVFAIIITILVLELKPPTNLTISAVGEVVHSLIAYSVSFFWLAVMWVNLHNEWERVKNVSLPMIWWSLFLLFLSSLLPYVTSLASRYFEDYRAQLLYGLMILLITIIFYVLGRVVERGNPGTTIRYSERFRKIEFLDYSLKFVSLILGRYYPPLVMLFVILTALMVSVSMSKYLFEHSQK